MNKTLGHMARFVIEDDVTPRLGASHFDEIHQGDGLAVGRCRIEGELQWWRLDDDLTGDYKLPVKYPGSVLAHDVLDLAVRCDELLATTGHRLTLVGADWDEAGADVPAPEIDARQAAEVKLDEAQHLADQALQTTREIEVERDQLLADADTAAADKAKLWVDNATLREERDFHKGRADDLAAQVERKRRRVDLLRDALAKSRARCCEMSRAKDKAGISGFVVGVVAVGLCLFAGVSILEVLQLKGWM